MVRRYWIFVAFAGGLVVAFVISLIFGSLSNLVAVVGIVSTLAVSVLGIRSQEATAKRQHQLEENKLQSELYLKYKLEKIRELYDALMDCVKTVQGLNPYDDVGQSAIDEAEKKLDAFMWQEIGTRRFIDSAESRRITAETYLACAKELDRRHRIFRALQAKKDPSKYEVVEDPYELRDKIWRALDCLGKILNPEYLSENVDMGTPV